MDEGPPGAEGYEDDSVTVKPNKKPLEDSCTKAEQEFLEHLNSLKIKLEHGETRPMVERRGRDVSGKWIYLCFPCGAMCSGESVLQTHISGKKHKTKLALRSVWPKSIYDDHPYNLQGKEAKAGSDASEKVLQKMAEEVDLHNKPPSDLDTKYNKYREVRCHIQDTIDVVKAPLLGLEYLIEHPPEQAHYEPSYICVLCSKQGHPRTIMNHMTCFWHRYNYLSRHFPKASGLLAPYRGQNKYREGVFVIMNRLAQRIEDKYGRLRPVNIDKEEYEKDKELIRQWMFKGRHLSEQPGCTFEEVVDADLIASLHQSNEDSKKEGRKSKDPSPPTVAAPMKPNYRRHDRRNSDELSDISDDHNTRRTLPERDHRRERFEPRHDARFRPYEDRRRPEEDGGFRTRFALRNPYDAKSKPMPSDKKHAPNYEHKLKLAADKLKSAEDSAKKTLAYHEKNPEKHPLYPEEWKKFWNRRYKEIQAEGKDPSKHDFKPEWIVFWTNRMKELHDEELRVNVIEIYRKLCLTPPNTRRKSAEREPRGKPIESRPRPRGYSHEHRRSPEPRRRSPEPRRRSPEHRRSPAHRRSPPDQRRRSPPDMRREMRRSPEFRRHSPLRHLRTRSRSPIPRARSPPRTHITLDSLRGRSRSPLSRRDEASRNRSPVLASHHGPSSQTVMISDDELKPDDNLSPWNSDNDLDSLGSLPDARSPAPPRSHAGSVVSSRASRPRQFPSFGGGARPADPKDLGPAENVVATLRLLVALEDYLGSLGPKIVDLMTEALKMEKDSPNSSEELLERESAVVLIETAKEKLKGAMQAGLVPSNAHAALRNAIVRAASTLHEADTRAKKKQQQQGNSKPSSTPALSVAGVGAVDRAQIAQQMAAALIAQGKTDVSSEELAQLVDAVVGMAEAKKREAEVKKKQEARAVVDKASRPPAPPPPSAAVKQSPASALQMLQSAYDENDKRSEKEDVPDAMDGLSDSDLETLLKNFNELSAEEQHSLIAYLKKLEAREPQRVERLRQYVSAAASSAPAASEPAPPPPKEDAKPVTIESDDDDDYTVEDVFKSVTQKVKEDQIRQEMEIVKKSLKETVAEPKVIDLEPTVDLTDTSSAAGLLALVQASIASSSSVQTPQDVVASVSANIPRSFGDAPEPAVAAEPKKLISIPIGNVNQQNFNKQGQQGPFNNQGPQGSFGNQAQQGSFGNQGPQGPLGNQGPGNQQFPPNQNNFGGPNQDFGGPNQGDFGGPNQGDFGGPNQGDFGGPNQGDFGGPSQGDFGGPNQGNFGGPPNQGDFGGPYQGDFGGPNQRDFGGPSQGDFGGPNQGNFGGPPNQGDFGGPYQGDFGGANPGNFGGQNQGNFGGPNQGNFGGANQSNFGGPNQGSFGAQNPGNLGGQNQSNFGGPPRNFGGPNQSNFGGKIDAPNQGNMGGPNQGNFRNFPNKKISPWENNNDNTGPQSRQPGGFGPSGDFNQGPRGGNMNGRMPNNFGKPPMDQSFGNQGNNFQGNNFQGNNNFRGRGGGGRGNFRGRGRGYF